MALSDLTRDAVISAIDEYDQIGRNAFLRNYGFGRARSYFAEYAGKRYDSKAIVGAAHGYLPGQSALAPYDFSGGDAVVGALLERLGFKVTGPSADPVDAAIKRVGGDHATALHWFRDHAGQTLSWTAIKAQAESGPRLVNQAKGIYKPHYTDYALSVRQTLGGPYADREIERRADGSWTYDYFQENPDPALRDREATNRGLVKCMEDGVPVGVLLQTKPKPGVEYEILGLAMVTDWNEGYFRLEGNPHLLQPDLEPQSAAEDARFQAETELATTEPVFDPSASREDLRTRVVAEVVRRRGQPKFRAVLLRAYGGRCAITRCDAAEALEAAHISPYLGDASNHVQNGLLLRADIHSLFDLGLLAIDPSTRKVLLSEALEKSSYAEFIGKRLVRPEQPHDEPSEDALRQHCHWAGFLNAPS